MCKRESAILHPVLRFTFPHLLKDDLVKRLLMLGLFLMVGSVFAQDQTVFGDMRPDAPELAARGDYGVGVRTMTLTHADQVDILNASGGDDAPTYERTLTVEIWYPAVIAEGESPTVVYEETLGRADNPDDPLVPFRFSGRALRDADVQIARVTDEFKTKVCGDRAAYESDPVALANALQRRADAINKIYVEELAKLDAKLLASGAKAEIDAKVADANFRLKTVDTVDEHIQRVREGVVPITPLLQGVCDQAKFGNADRGA